MRGHKETVVAMSVFDTNKLTNTIDISSQFGDKMCARIVILSGDIV